LPPVIESAQKQGQGATGNDSGRVEFMVHDFLTEQPVRGADVYFLRWVLHNWSDKDAVRILRSLVPALKTGARIVVCDTVLPRPGALPKWIEDRLRSVDLCMTELQNSHDRELEEWEQLFAQADSRFHFRGGEQPAGSNLWIMVAEWKGE
jgi:hypothetical protein